MGLLAKGTPLSWEKSKVHFAYVKKHGIIQFLNIWNSTKDNTSEIFKWGDEIEYMLVSITEDSKSEKKAQLLMKGDKLLDEMERVNAELTTKYGANHCAQIVFHPEYGRHMIEATPGLPYDGFLKNLKNVEQNMILRRQAIELLLKPQDGEYAMAITVFPLMGTPEHGPHTVPAQPTMGPVANSPYISDEMISPHPRFATLTKNIRTRRGANVDIRVPLYQDKKTDMTDPIIHADAMGFGMGSSCLQVTFNTRSVPEARGLYDQLAILSPVFMAATAASPFFRGKIAATDTRWAIISQAVDCRNDEERGLKPLSEGVQRIHKSRYDSIDSYIGTGPNFKPEYNDIDLVMDDKALTALTEGGVDESMARHIAHLWIRDPLVIFDEHVVMDDVKCSDHFENLQSTNWQNVRFKPPAADNLEMGYRVEFRTMEVQLTEYENAAFSVFITLLSRAILFFDINLYVPISKVTENMVVAETKDAVNQAKFFYRTVIDGSDAKNGEDEYSMLSAKEIFVGTAKTEGLISIVNRYVASLTCDAETQKMLNSYIALIKGRVTGELMTLAKFLRCYVASHPSYNKDSQLNHTIVADALRTLVCIEKGSMEAIQFLPKSVVLQQPTAVKPTKTSTAQVLSLAVEEGQQQPSPADSDTTAEQEDTKQQHITGLTCTTCPFAAAKEAKKLLDAEPDHTTLDPEVLFQLYKSVPCSSAGQEEDEASISSNTAYMHASPVVNKPRRLSMSFVARPTRAESYGERDADAPVLRFNEVHSPKSK